MISTPIAPLTSVWAEKRPITSCRRRSCAIVRKPSTASCTIGRGSRISGGSSVFSSPASISADQTNVPAVTAKTTQVLETASRTPPIAGPAQKPRLSRVLELTFAAVSSSGVRASARPTSA